MKNTYHIHVKTFHSQCYLLSNDQTKKKNEGEMPDMFKCE